MNNKERITVSEIILLVLMVACFIATLAFYMLGNKELFLIFFVLHCCLCMGFFLVSQDIFMKAFLDTQEKGASLEEELALLKQNEEDLKELRKSYEALTIQHAELSKEHDELIASKSALETQVEELKATPATLADTPLGHLLPEDENPQSMNIIEVVQNVLDDMRPFSEPCGVTLQLSSASDNITVKADPAFIKIMLRNIVDNSIKYMNRTGSLVITVSSIGDDLFIVLKDNGDGLSVNETEHIFELNYQGSNRISGNGLGLSQAKAIVKYYGGTIYAKSGSGKGMGIYIQLPAAPQG